MLQVLLWTILFNDKWVIASILSSIEMNLKLNSTNTSKNENTFCNNNNSSNYASISKSINGNNTSKEE